MKTFVVLLTTTAACAGLMAADVNLVDGRVLKNAAVVSQAPRSVMIRHEGGLSSVAKELLPPELQSQYPIDEAAARRAQEQALVAGEAAKAAHQAEAERVARVRAERAANVEAANLITENEARSLEREQARVKMAAQDKAQSYFLYEHSWSPGENRECDVTISDVRPVQGWPGRWLVRGFAVLRSFRPDPNFEANTQGMTAREIRRARYDRTHYNTQTVQFEANYTRNEGAEPSFEVTVR